MEGSNGATTPNSRLFVGHERDKEVRLDYMIARYFSPFEGRFMTPDVGSRPESNLEVPERWNRYLYSRNNPIRYLDPDGNAEVDFHIHKASSSQSRSDIGSSFRGAIAKTSPQVFNSNGQIALDRFSTNGNSFQTFYNSATAPTDLANSLGKSGAFVGYLGHTLTVRGVTSLNPNNQNPTTGPAQMSRQELNGLLSGSKAAVVLLGGCNTVSCVGKPSVGGPAIIGVQPTGKSLYTDISNIIRATHAFVDKLIGVHQNASEVNLVASDPGTVGDAIKAGNAVFQADGAQARFVLISGSPDTTLGP